MTLRKISLDLTVRFVSNRETCLEAPQVQTNLEDTSLNAASVTSLSRMGHMCVS